MRHQDEYYGSHPERPSDVWNNGHTKTKEEEEQKVGNLEQELVVQQRENFPTWLKNTTQTISESKNGQ